MFNDYKRINKTRTPHTCAVTGETIPEGSSCWKFVGVWEGDFQSWYCTNEAKEFIDKLPYDPGGYECAQVGDMMREEKKGVIPC